MLHKKNSFSASNAFEQIKFLLNKIDHPIDAQNFKVSQFILIQF